MSWREQLQPASFRGVRFEVIGASGTFGRRTVLHEFPFKDVPLAEDLGRRAREIHVEGMILGADYRGGRDALIEACEQAGSAKLVHPYLGELTVSVTDSGLTIDETTDQGGMCRISFNCVETGEARFPTAQPATQDLVAMRADEGLLASLQQFPTRFSLDNLPSWAQQLSIDRATGFLDRVRSAISPVASAAGSRGLVASLIDAFSPSVSTSLRSGTRFIEQAQQIVQSIRTGFEPASAYSVLGSLADFGAGEFHLPATTPTRQRDATNRDALVETLRTTVAIERARAVSQMEFADYREAETVRDSALDQIDLVADATSDDVLFESLVSLRAAVVRDVNARGANLARVVSVTPVATMPALVLAYNLYQDASREAEIVSRNRTLRPGFVAAAGALEVLTNV